MMNVNDPKTWPPGARMACCPVGHSETAPDGWWWVGIVIANVKFGEFTDTLTVLIRWNNGEQQIDRKSVV